MKVTAGMALRVGRGWGPTFGKAIQGAQTPRAVPGFRCECSEPLVLDSQQLLKKAGRPGMGGYLLRQSAPWWSRVKTLPIPRLGPASAQHTRTYTRTHARTQTACHADTPGASCGTVSLLGPQLRKAEIGTTPVRSRSADEMWLF